MRRLALLVGFCLVLLACGNSEPTPLATVASHPGGIGTGEQRVMFALVDPETNEWVAAPDREATVTLRDENGAPLDTYETEFVWAVEDTRGLYVANLVIPEAGNYQITIDADGFSEAGPAGLVASEDPSVIQRGEPAPPSESRVGADYPDLSIITSDPDPDPAMYEVSVADAVASGHPTVIAFATPAFCSSEACGPMLDQVKALQASYPDVEFVHVEVYDDLQVADFNDLTVVPAVEERGLPSEPWVFVVDGSGTVSAAFEGAVAEDELTSAIEAVSG
jgi:hypothetical protein